MISIYLEVSHQYIDCIAYSPILRYHYEIIGSGGKRRSKTVPPPPPPRPPPPPPKETAASAFAEENGPSPLPPPPPPRTSLIRHIDQELRDGAESFVQEDDIIPASLSPACVEKKTEVDDEEQVRGSANSSSCKVIAAGPALSKSSGGNADLPPISMACDYTCTTINSPTPSPTTKATSDRVTVMLREKEAAARFELLSSSIATANMALDDFDGPTTVLPPTSLANVPTPCKKGTAETCRPRAAIASKEVEARARLALLSCSVVSAERAFAAMENETELEAERAAAKLKREEERRTTEVMFTNAATVIQAAARRHCARRAYNRIGAATISLQAFARQCLAKNKQYRIRAYIHSSATRIQALARGVNTRRQVQAELASIVFLQAFARGTMVRNRKKACDMAITPFQALVRGRIDRNRVKVIKWYNTNKRPSPKPSNARKLSVSFVPSSPVSIEKGPDVIMSGDLMNILLDASQGSEGAKDRAIAAKKVLIRNTSLYVPYINALMSAKIDVGGNLETVLSNSIGIEAIVNELVCFLAMLGQDTRRVFIPGAKIHSAHSVLVEKCPHLYVEICRALGCKSGYIPMVDEYFHHTDTSLGDEDLKARYELTRTTYAVLFKSKPPLEFWPAPSAPDCSNVGVRFEKLDEKHHLSFLNEENLHDDDDNDNDTFNDDYYDEEESVDVSTVYGTTVFDMYPGVLVRELQYLAEDQSRKVVDELRNVGLKVGETLGKASVKKSALMSFFDS